jgi:hypothetical protein
MALAADWITVPSKICSDLSIRYGESLSVLEFKTIKPHLRKPFKVEDDKVDMLSLIPPTSGNGYPIYVDEHEKAGESWLRVWYYHTRGAARQTELKRYVDISKLGQLLGQLQAEGNKKGSAIVFKNSSISEHADFVTALRELGISPPNIRGRCIFNPNKSTPRDVKRYSDAYKKATDTRISSFDECAAMKGAIVVDTYVRSAVLTAILISAMNETRRGHYDDQELRQPFLAKLLNGDGTLDARKTSRRLDVRLKIVDQNMEYLRDYATLLTKEGFRAKVLPEKITVRAYCTWLNLITLYRIDAFRGNSNWIKLLCSMKIALDGRETRGYKRIQELSNSKAITSRDVCFRYDIGNRAANLWLVRMKRLRLIERLESVDKHRCTKYRTTGYGRTICATIAEMERDYRKISFEKNSEDAETILKEVKVKGACNSRSTEECT